jgi:hypothetical protein
MSRTTVNFLLDALLLVIFLSLVWVSLVIRLLFPPGTNAAGYTLWGVTYDGWCQFQFVLLSFIVLAILLHVMMHWSWVCGVVTNRLSRIKGQSVRLDEGSQTLYGVAMLIGILSILGAALVAAYLSLQAPIR